MRKFLPLLLLLAPLFQGCYDDSDLRERIDRVEHTVDGRGERVASVAEQKADMLRAIDNLKQADRLLLNYIDILAKKDDELDEALAATEAEYERIAALLESEVSESNASLYAEFKSTREYINRILNANRDKLDKLQNAETVLNGHIDGLAGFAKDFFDTHVNTEWLYSTFVTLEQYNAFSADIAGTKELCASLFRDLNSLETRLYERWDSAFAAAQSSLDGQLSGAINDLESSWSQAFSSFKDEMTAAWNADLNKALSDSENSIKQWLGGVLSDYYTIEETDALLASLESSFKDKMAADSTYLVSLLSNVDHSAQLAEIEQAIADLESASAAQTHTVDSLERVIDGARDSLTNVYREAIAEAILELDGYFGSLAEEMALEAIEEKLTGVMNDIEAMSGRIDALEQSIGELSAQVSGLAARIDEIVSMIVSVRSIPAYADGSVRAAGGRVVLNYLIAPSSAAQSLSSVPQALKVRAVETQTRAAVLVELPIRGVSATPDGVLTVTADCSSLNFSSAAVSLEISSGSSSLTSSYVNLVL